MTITKYCAEGFAYGAGRIEAVQIERETESSIWLHGRRHGKLGDYHRYYGSWEEAHAFLMARAEQAVLAARRQLELANARHGNVKGMKKPEAA